MKLGTTKANRAVVTCQFLTDRDSSERIDLGAADARWHEHLKYASFGEGRDQLIGQSAIELSLGCGGLNSRTERLHSFEHL